MLRSLVHQLNAGFEAAWLHQILEYKPLDQQTLNPELKPEPFTLSRSRIMRSRMALMAGSSGKKPRDRNYTEKVSKSCRHPEEDLTLHLHIFILLLREINLEARILP